MISGAIVIQLTSPSFSDGLMKRIRLSTIGIGTPASVYAVCGIGRSILLGFMENTIYCTQYMQEVCEGTNIGHLLCIVNFAHEYSREVW